MQRPTFWVNVSIFTRLKEMNICATKSSKRGTKSFGYLKIPSIIGFRPRFYKQSADRDVNIRTRPPSTIVQLQQLRTSSAKTCTSLQLVNARSVVNKTDFISEHIQENSVGIMAITETWLKESDEHIINELCPDEYTYIGIPRPLSKGKTGGGVGFVLAPGVRAQKVTNKEYRTFEMVTIKIGSRHPLHVSLIYRPPCSSKNKHTATEFLHEIEEYLTSLCSNVPGDLCVLGDFNVHWGKEGDSVAREFSNIISSLEMKQHVKHPTHKSQHTLDLIITRCLSDDRVRLNNVTNIGISDHYLIACDVDVVPSKQQKRTVTCRPWKRVNIDGFAHDLEAGLQHLDDSTDVETLAASFLEICQRVSHVHAPLKTITVKGDGLKPWYSDDIHEARVIRRRYERLYNKSNLEIHRQMYVEQSHCVVRLIQRSKSNYYKEKFTDADAKETFKLVGSLLNSNQPASLPSDLPTEQMPQVFSDFFHDKAHKIRTRSAWN
eukprot:GHVO01015045.1.p1 GENE.GHVO01015045.1~~GHVO01015045.1.p1  ORF type:complete len:491 (-),score=38.71 GHVO01015045.1:344-1816(-)